MQRQPAQHKKEQATLHFYDHDPLHLQPDPAEEEEPRRRNYERHPELWKVNPTRALIVGDMEAARRAIPVQVDPIPHLVRGEFSPKAFDKESAIAGIGGMGRDYGLTPVRRKSIMNSESQQPAPHRITLLQQARVWSYCV